MWLGLPNQADASWGVLLLFAPDLSAALLVVAGLFLLTGLVRVLIAGLSHFTTAPASVKPLETLAAGLGVAEMQADLVWADVNDPPRIFSR
jgi:hypothetical protein